MEMIKMKEKLNALLEKLGPIYEASDIKKFCEKEGHEWSYSLVNASMERSAPLILGFNWGAAQGEKYPSQSHVEKTNFETSDVGSLRRIDPFIREHFGQDYLSKANQSNYCFFRSSTEDQINETDIRRCSGVFAELIEILAPSSIICLSAKLRKHLIDTNQVHARQEKAINFKRGSAEIEFVAVRGKLASVVDIKFLPHPNYPMKRDARSEAWKFCCESQ
jgi:hypothetical protein